MKRFTLSLLLGLAISLPVYAGEIDGSGKQAPSPTPPPSGTTSTTLPSATLTPGSETSTLDVLVMEVLLTALIITA